MSPVRGVYAEGSMPGGVDLSAALRALADAGLPEDALRVAVEAILRAARTSAPPAMGPRLVGGA